MDPSKTQHGNWTLESEDKNLDLALGDGTLCMEETPPALFIAIVTGSARRRCRTEAIARVRG